MRSTHDCRSQFKAASQRFLNALGLVSGHGGEKYEMLLNHDKEMVAQLHRWDTHDHPHRGKGSDPSCGNGVLMRFATDRLDDAVAKVKQHKAKMEDVSK